MSMKDLFINNYVSMLSKKYQMDVDPKKNENLAFEIFSIAVILDKPFEEVYDSIQIRNDEDGGFDGIYMEQIDSTSYVQHVFQCKNTSTLKKNELNKFESDYKKIFIDGNESNQINIKGILQYIDEYKELTEQRVIISSCLYFVFNGDKFDKENQNFNLFNSYNKPNEFEIYDKNDLYEKIASSKKTNRKNVEFVFTAEKSTLSPKDPQAMYSYAIGNVKAVNFRVKTESICELLLNERKINGSEKYLFEENIRSYLKTKAKPNLKMLQTLKSEEDAVYFPFFNNGITLVVEQLDIPLAAQSGQYLIKVKNPQIVNGLQTSKVLLEVYEKNPELLEGVCVNVRIYETDNEKLIEKITDATNTQTPINFKDKLSTNLFMINTKKLFETNGINLVLKRGESFLLSEEKSELDTVSSEVILKFWYATFYERPEIAKNSISTILQQFYDAMISSTGILAAYFENYDNKLYEQFLIVYKIYRIVQKCKLQHKDLEYIKSVDELLSYGIYKELNGNFLNLTDKKLEQIYEEVLLNLDKLFKLVKNDFLSSEKVFSYNNFLKNSICRIKYNELFLN